LILDSGGLSRLAERTTLAAALQRALRRDGLWPPIVPAVVLVESLTGNGGRDASTNRFLKACDIVSAFPEKLARRAASLRHRARRGSAVDALVVANAEPGGLVLTSDPDDLGALAQHAAGVVVQAV
jgi:predicted nucleic acid-binding protein